MADAEEGLVGADGSAETPTYGSAESTDKQPPPFDSLPEEDPPSYKSILQEMKDAKKTSDGNVDFITKLLNILLNTVLFTVFMAIILLVPICMVVIGAVHINDCPVQKMIPIYLIVSGSVHIIKTVLDLTVRYKKRQARKARDGSAREASYTKEDALSRMLGCVVVVFFILGNIWVYANFRPDESPLSPNYCDPGLYYFSFWILTLAYIFLILGCCCTCCTITIIGIGIIS